MAVAFRTPAVTSVHLKKEEPRAGGDSRLLSLDIFEPRGGVSGDGGCRSTRAEAPKGERQLQLHLSVVPPECLYRCRAGRKEKSRLWAAAQVPYSLMARLRRHPPCARALMQASAPFRSGQSHVADQDGCRSSSASPAMFNCQPPSLILQTADIAPLCPSTAILPAEH